MKKLMLFSGLLLLCSHFAFAQDADYKVVFDFTNSSSQNQDAVVRQVSLIKQEDPDAKLEVVAYGGGLDLMLKDKSGHADAIEKLLTDPDISFKACAGTLKRKQMDQSQLIPGVEVVRDGIYEIVSKQKEGWGYIKVAN